MSEMEKNCAKCGKVFSGVGSICPECSRTMQEMAETPSQSSFGGIKAIEQSRYESPPASIKSCNEENALIRSLWNWAENIEKYGLVCFVLIILYGLFEAWTGATTTTSSIYGEQTELSLAIFIATIITYLIYAIVEYIVYHVIALLMASLAKIVQSTRATARIAEYNALQNQGGNES